MSEQTMNAQPVATYSERLLEVRRDFALYDDRIVVQACWFPRRRFEHVVKLAALKGESEEITLRYRLYRYAGWIIAIGALAFAVCSYSARDAAMGPLSYGALGLTVCGVVLLALTYPLRRIRFARFPTHTGRVGLDIGSAGNDTASFENFVRQVRRHIPR